jgi:hypothetical protein
MIAVLMAGGHPLITKRLPPEWCRHTYFTFI